jgi:hypothetical protein
MMWYSLYIPCSGYLLIQVQLINNLFHDEQFVAITISYLSIYGLASVLFHY